MSLFMSYLCWTDWRSRRRRSSSFQCFLSFYCDEHDCVSSASWISPQYPCCCGDWRRSEHASTYTNITASRSFILFFSKNVKLFTRCGNEIGISYWRRHQESWKFEFNFTKGFLPFLCCWMSLRNSGRQTTSCSTPFVLFYPYDSENTHIHTHGLRCVKSPTRPCQAYSL